MAAILSQFDAAQMAPSVQPEEPAMTEADEPMLRGVTVLSLAEQYPGPYATLLLADLGAEVVMIERPGIGDPARAFPDFFKSLARNKYSVSLDLKTERGKRELLRLVSLADAFVEGFRPGVAERLGFGYETLVAQNPRLVYASISGFGQDGPYRDRLAHDLSYQATSGMLFDRRAAELQLPAMSFADLTAGTFAAFAIATALFARERTGRGRYIDIAMADCLVSWMTTHLGPLLNGGAPLTATDEPAYGVFRCADGRTLTLSIAHEDHFWRPLCELVGLIGNAGLHHQERLRDRASLRDHLRQAIAEQPLAYWSDRFDQHGIPWSPLLGLDDVVGDPHFRARGMFQTVPNRNGATEFHVMQPIKFGGSPGRLRHPAPALGEHNAQFLKE
jgi:crotonobetainyl-CoA:carnitine CoA-transferase CaiB-like acyl-CoA transferase